MKSKIRMQKIDVLMPTCSQYHVLHHFARKLYEAFVRAGMSCRLLEGNDRITATLNDPPDFTIGFNGALKMEDGSLFCDYINVPHVSCLVDPPYRFPEITKSPNVIITCDDKECCKMLHARGFQQTAFMPHAVEKELCPDPKAKRIYDVVFLGTCIDFEGRRQRWKEEYPKSTVKAMEEAAEAALSEDVTSFMTALQEKLNPWDNQKIYEEVELYIKGKDRFNLVNAVKGHKVHVFGGSADEADWKKLLKGKTNVVVHPAVDYEKALEIMKQSKVVLNSSIKNKLGAHERIFTAAACGAVVVTNSNAYIRKNFKHGKDILLYRCNAFDALSDDVNNLLDNPDKLAAVAAAGRKNVMHNHTWDCRVKMLIDFLGGEAGNSRESTN